MKKLLKKAGLSVLLAVMMITPVFAKDISIYINNQRITTSDAPYIKENRTLVPIRVISENLGVKVDWNQSTREVLLEKDAQKTILPIGKKHYIKNGTKTATDIAPEIKNDRTFVPLRLIAELYGKQVNWDQASYSVLINEQGISPQLPKSTNSFEAARVVRVVDGDTIVIDRGKGQEKIRMILVNTPETKHPTKGVEFFGKEASAFTTNALTGKTVYLQKDVSETDRYGRLLRYVWTERPASNNPSNAEIRSKCFNAALLAGGYAQLSTFPPDLKYVDLFRQIQNEARQANMGLWAGGTVAPEQPGKQNPSNTGGGYKNPSDPAYLYANGRIIGNSNSMIYHLPSGKSYKKVSMKNAAFFNSAQEAQAAGYRQAKR